MKRVQRRVVLIPGLIGIAAVLIGCGNYFLVFDTVEPE